MKWLKNLWYDIEEESRRGFIATCVAWCIISLVVGMIIGIGRNPCDLDTRFGQFNLPFRGGCWLTETVK